jgi:cellulose synthase/poly-beta-1,6-N-acetylglucosamine synthase-like glycosyltransferase
MAAQGTLLTVFDAEDRPDPYQLRLAAARFATASPRVACLQARLAIDIHWRNPLSLLLAIEYAALFDVLNTGTAALRLPLALGGTSNHFRIDALREAGGWDAWNVTEDADLGLRLARLGYDIECLDSTTLEQAPNHLAVWLRQRRRWMKGWIQTFLVLARAPRKVVRELGIWRSVGLALSFVNLLLGPLLLPLFAPLVIFGFVRNGFPAPMGVFDVMEATIAVSVLFFGAFELIFRGFLGLRARGLTRLMPVLPLILPYQLLIGLAGWWALVDLIRKPYHWHKTPHRGSGAIERKQAHARRHPRATIRSSVASR